MDKVKRVSIKLLIIFISIFFTDGGKTILLIGNNIQILLNHNQNSDLEIPHLHNLNKSDDDEKWMNSNSFGLSCLYKKLPLFPYYLNKRAEDYTVLVWQPPKSL